MQNPSSEIVAVVSLLTAAAVPEVQKAAFYKYMTPDAGFRHPICSVTPGAGSRDQMLGIFQWYRIMSPNIDIKVNSVVHDTANNVILLDVVQRFHIRLSPFKPAPSRLLVRLTLRLENGLYRIAMQEDFYHPDDFMSLLVPPLAPLVRTKASSADEEDEVKAEGTEGHREVGVRALEAVLRLLLAVGESFAAVRRVESVAQIVQHPAVVLHLFEGGAKEEGFEAIPDRLSDASHTQLIKSFNSLKKDPDRPLRPGYGTQGTPITLRANFFAVRLPAGPIYDYSVEINPKTDINRLKARIFFLLEQSNECRPFLNHIAHDRSQRLVSAQRLPQPLDILVRFYEDGESGPKAGGIVYTVSIKFDKELDVAGLKKYLSGDAGSRDYNTLPLISALNLVLQQHPTRAGVRVGKNRYFFPTSSESFPLSPGVVAFQGFYTSVRPTFKQLMVNVNNCMTAFVQPGNLADALLAFGRNTHGALPNLPKPLAKSIKVTTKHLGYKMRKPIKNIPSRSAADTTFDCEEFGGRISVETYFLKKYKIKLKYARNLPVIDIGSSKKSVFVPAELCEIEPGQAYRGKLSGSETQQMIKIACNPPRFNAEAITTEGFSQLGLNPVQTPVNGFGVAIETEMAVVPGRELPPPRLTYSKGNARVQNGSWNIMDVKFHRGASVAGWAVLVVRDGNEILAGPADERLKTLVERFRNKLRNSGMQIAEGLPKLLSTPSLQNFQDNSREVALSEIRKVLDNAIGSAGRKPSFILVLLSHTDNYIYPGIKKMCDVDIGVHTVHMQLGKALGDERKQDQYLSNVCLKVNSKLGGMNHLLDPTAMRWLTKHKTMMVGIDVTHPGPGSREGSPSIAAMVASVDDNFVQFPASMRIQRPDPNRESKEVRVEFIVLGMKPLHAALQMLSELRDMLVERLLAYEKKNKALPQRIIVFRDGVSEGQFDIVIREEKAQILEAFQRLSTKDRGPKPYRPAFSIIICGKRHHARFYPTSTNTADQKGNTRPGTVVDKGVTAVFDFDFYLQAHAGLQGTVRPTHYTVVYDELNFTADELQKGSNDFSYLYARATKAVSLIPAAYYADLACERGRYYLNDFMVDDKATTSGRGKSDRQEERDRVFNAARQAWGQGIHPDLRDSMFYI
ncbi:protein argonaute 1B [Favolaschia claudopus]|uniref:Protein argonaute 1B n=1 Tax=Favolaschia claudopus TaxID=2862362 RepID=A0AAW0CMB9_9AGAR